MPQQALNHCWLSGDNATDHNLLPEIKAYMAKARLRRGIEMVKLANRIEALKMQEDEEERVPQEADIPADPRKAAAEAHGVHADRAAESGGKRSLSQVAKVQSSER